MATERKSIRIYPDGFSFGGPLGCQNTLQNRWCLTSPHYKFTFVHLSFLWPHSYSMEERIVRINSPPPSSFMRFVLHFLPSLSLH